MSLDRSIQMRPGGPKAYLGDAKGRVDVPGREPMQGRRGHFQAGQRRTLVVRYDAL